MDKANVTAPALIARDLPGFVTTGRRFPERLEIHAVIAEVADRLPHFAGPDAPIEVNHGGCFTGSASHGPLRRLARIGKLGAVMKRQGSHVGSLLQPLPEHSSFEQAVSVMPLQFRNSRIDLAQGLALNVLQAGILGITTNQVEIMGIDQPFAADPFGQRDNFVHIVPREHGIEVNPQALSMPQLQPAQHPGTFDGLVEIARNAAHRIVRVASAVQSDIDVHLKVLIFIEAVFRDLENPAGLQAIRRQVDVADTVVADKQVNNLRKFAPQGRFAATEPEIGKLWRGLRQPDNFIPGQVTLLVEFIPIETRVTRRITV